MSNAFMGQRQSASPFGFGGYSGGHSPPQMMEPSYGGFSQFGGFDGGMGGFNPFGGGGYGTTFGGFGMGGGGLEQLHGLNLSLEKIACIAF